ncbi:MAG: hypothetical protein V4732_22395 [Pseudomonadota bacterium]
MRIETYSINRLKESLDHDELWQTQRIAISKNRAISAIHNPRAQKDDVVLAAAFEGDKLVGYHGALPDTIYVDNEPHRFAWGSCWWVDDALRGQRIGSLLKEKLITCWQQRFASRDVSPDALRSMTKSGLAKAFKKENGIDFQFQYGTLNANKYSDMSDWDKNTHLPPGYRIEYLSQLDTQARKFIDQNNIHEIFRRSSNELNWIKLYPWCSQEPDCKLAMLQQSYFFDLKYSRFFNVFIKILDNKNNVTAVMMLMVCNDRLSVPYIYYNEDSLPLICSTIGKLIFHLGITHFRTYNEYLIASMKIAGPPVIAHINVQRTTLFSPDMYNLPKRDAYLQDGDGDCAFWA